MTVALDLQLLRNVQLFSNIKGGQEQHLDDIQGYKQKQLLNNLRGKQQQPEYEEQQYSDSK